MCIENATIGDLQEALAGGKTTASALVRAYLARIEAYDRAGRHLNAVREVNPDALAIAAALDGGKPAQRRLLAEILISADKRLYISEADTTLNAAPPAQYQASLQILDDDGVRIRYRAVGNPERVR